MCRIRDSAPTLLAITTIMPSRQQETGRRTIAWGPPDPELIAGVTGVAGGTWESHALRPVGPPKKRPRNDTHKIESMVLIDGNLVTRFHSELLAVVEEFEDYLNEN